MSMRAPSIDMSGRDAERLPRRLPYAEDCSDLAGARGHAMRNAMD